MGPQQIQPNQSKSYDTHNFNGYLVWFVPNIGTRRQYREKKRKIGGKCLQCVTFLISENDSSPRIFESFIK